jgi:glycosyltransferase involved in cell wall biosynthesis
MSVERATGPAAARPLISVIVPTFNSADVIDGALQSLADQTWRGFEVVISDGASRDGTLAQVQARAAELPALSVLSRPDRGVYDAINLAIDAARGEWVLVLGSDDRLHERSTLAHIAPMLAGSTFGFVYGDVRTMAAITPGVAPGGRYGGPMHLADLMRANICQQAIFYRRSLFDELGRFDLRLPVWADWAFNLRVAFRFPTQWVDLVVADYAATGVSSKGATPAEALAITELIREELVHRARDRSTWPLQRFLLRQADAYRRGRAWRLMFANLASYLLLVSRRFSGPAGR